MLNLKNTLDGYLKNIEVIGNTVQDTNNLANIRSVGDKVEGQELYNISIQVDNGNGVSEVVEILSPVQLEKVGDVVDRIICKDGVWGVDKKVDAEVKDSVLVNTRTNSEFIPLPHDQQVKLRTFAGQTNISFLTETAGQIKAQVPKSLGATVNTHTEQISNLNKELDRVKKLEETTVSTIETGSNFTTVDATSNGYFEDVKLEGKTLVNLAKPINSTHYVVNNGGLLSSNEFNSVIDGSFCGFIQKDISMYKPNTTYTAIVNIKSNTTSTKIFALNKLGSALSVVSNSVLIAEPQQAGTYVITFVTRESIDTSYKGFNIICNGAYTGQYTVSSVVILEGDHTNNPPEYFEGLMSVGQDVEEISVESESNNILNRYKLKYGFFMNSSNVIGSNDNYYITDYIPITTGEYTFSGFERSGTHNKTTSEYADDIVVSLYDSNKSYKTFLTLKVIDGNANLSITQSEVAYIKTSVGVKDYFTANIQKTSEYTPYQLNKKPLLYYNPTTETWEKPVLREWDTIEKHSDGKYYYHKRSGEVVFNDEFTDVGCWSNNPGDVVGFYWYSHQVTDVAPKTNGLVINNLLPNNVGGHYATVEGFRYTNYFAGSIHKDKLGVTDVNDYTTCKSKLLEYLGKNNITAVYQLAQEEVYECTNIDLMTYSGETNYIINSGAISPKSLLKVHNNISNVVKILQEKVSLLEKTFIAGLRSVLAGDMYSLATILYPEDFEQNDNIENDIMVIPE